MPQNACPIPDDLLFLHYHDSEWGHPVDNDQSFLEKVILEGFQAGLSWKTVLHKREAFRSAFHHFDGERIANYTEADVQRLLKDPGIIRNRRKVLSAINNARRAPALRQEFGSLARFFWQFEPAANRRPATVTRRWLEENTQTPESEALSRALKRRGWTFVGPTNMYALMQATGIVNDHVSGCPQRGTTNRLRRAFVRP